MQLEDINLHDSTIIRVIEVPAKSLLAFELDYVLEYPADSAFVAKTLVFRDPLDYRVDEGPFQGNPALLDAHIERKGTRYEVVLETNAGRRSLSYSQVELLDGHGAVETAGNAPP